MKKDLLRLSKELRRAGYEVTATRKGHLMVSRDGNLIATFSGTPSDWRSMKNGLSKLRRSGFTWPPR